MKDTQEFEDFLRKEAESLNEKIESIELRMSKILLRDGVSKLDKINSLDREKELLKAQMFKLYELIGRL